VPVQQEKTMSAPQRLGVGAVVAVAAALALAGCSSTSTEVMPPTVNVSIGQQLIDMKRARDSGALSNTEYEQQVRRLIDSVK
jgi:uncharacterized lipoprotein YbaY